MPRRLRPERSVAQGWASGWRATVRGAAGVALFGAALVIGLISFTALTLAGGGPCYEHIAEKVDDDLGSVPTEAEMSWWRLLGRGLRDGVLLVLRSLMVTVLLLLAGFLPVVGQTVVAVLLALVTAWFLALELVAVPFSRRGWDLKQRRELLSTRRALALGLGTPATQLCMIPLAAIIVMPVAFAAAYSSRTKHSASP
jgi:CysZ protein